MSIATNPNLSAFLRWLRNRPHPDGGFYSEGRLAEELTIGRAQLSQVINGRRAGARTWRRIVRGLPEDGLSLLKQCPSWNNFAEEALHKREGRAAPISP